MQPYSLYCGPGFLFPFCFLRFDSFDERTKRRAALSAMPEWRAFLGKVVSLVVAQRSQLLTPTSFSPIR